jgi:hypothetical protein
MSCRAWAQNNLQAAFAKKAAHDVPPFLFPSLFASASNVVHRLPEWRGDKPLDTDTQARV